MSEKASRGRAELTSPKSPITFREFPIKCTRPATPAKRKPLLIADPFNDPVSAKHNTVKIMNAPSATRSNVI